MKRCLWILSMACLLMLSAHPLLAQDKNKSQAAPTEKVGKKAKAEKDSSATKARPDKQADAVERAARKMEAEETKHRERVARLERIGDLLSEKGNDQAVQSLKKVLGKENQRYERAMARLRKQNQKAADRFERKMERVRRREKKGRGGPKQGSAKKEKAEDADDQEAKPKRDKPEGSMSKDDEGSRGKGKGKQKGQGKAKGKNKDE